MVLVGISKGRVPTCRILELLDIGRALSDTNVGTVSTNVGWTHRVYQRLVHFTKTLVHFTKTRSTPTGTNVGYLESQRSSPASPGPRRSCASVVARAKRPFASGAYASLSRASASPPWFWRVGTNVGTMSEWLASGWVGGRVEGSRATMGRWDGCTTYWYW